MEDKATAEAMNLPVWAGVPPMCSRRMAPVPDALCSAPAPDYVEQWAN